MKPLTLMAVLVASSAWAQNYVVSSSPMTYLPISGGTSRLSSFTSFDDSSITVPIGFSFPYYGATYTQVLINTNGFASFTTTAGTCSSGCNNNSPSPIPSSTRTPHLIIAPWWDDHQYSTGVGDIITSSTTSQFDVEWKNVGAWSGSGFTYSLNFKLTLFASGVIQVHYGPTTGSGGSAVAGFEDGTGTMGSSFLLPPNNMTCSATTSSCTLANFPSNTVYTIGQPVTPDLVVQAVNLNSAAKTGPDLALSITPTFRNFGMNAANGFFWRAYLSTDRVLSPATDTFVLNSTTPLNCAGGTTVSDTAAATITAPPNGNYYVLVEVDWNNLVNEGPFGEGNNVGSTATYFVSGLDLVATSVSGPSMSGPGNLISVAVSWFNQGTDNAGNVEYGIYLSTDNLWSTNDFLLFGGTKTIAGGQTVNENLMITVPQNVPGGDFFYILKVNTGNPPISESPANNTAVSSAKVTVRQSDLVIKSVDFVDATTGTPVRTGLFGTPARMVVTASNEGGADARNFKVGVVISADTNLSLLQDTIVIESPVMQVLQGTTVTLDVPFTLPLNDRAMRPFTTGNWFFFALLDSGGQITELNEFNNNMMLMQPVLVNAPAPDLTVVRFDAPSSAGVGEVVPIYRVFKNIGNVGASDVKYRYYVSANAQVTVDDTPVQFTDTNGTVRDFGSVTMPAGAVEAGTDFLQIPPAITPGTYYLGAVLDAVMMISELDETNNSLASMPVVIAPSSFRISTTALPDAVIGRPYSFQLSVQGDVPGMPTTWAIDTAQGSLPAGLTLNQMTGLLGGTPTAETVVGVTFTAQNNSRTAVARLAIRVLPTTTQVEITTPSLPSLINNTTVMYETWLGAAGGVKPYAWRLVPVTGEVLPRNLTLFTDGRLAGVPATGLIEKAYPVTFEVRDSLGTTAQRKYNLRVVAPGAIVFTNLSIPDALVGVDYLTDIAVRNFDMSPLAKPLQYRVVSGALPDGIEMVVEQDVLLLQGNPKVAGTFAFTIEVEDAKGRNDSADFLLRVYPAGLKVSVNDLPTQLRPGDPVDFSFVVSGASGVVFNLFSGALPPGATLGPDGHVTGMVENEGAEGTFNFVVEARDPAGATGIGAFTVLVKRDLVQPHCSCGATGGAAWLLLLLVLVPLRRRRVAG